MWVKLPYGTTAPARYPAERFKLHPQGIYVGIRRESLQTPLIKKKLCTNPPPALAHHDQADIDKLLPLDARKIAHDGILKQVIFLHQLHVG